MSRIIDNIKDKYLYKIITIISVVCFVMIIAVYLPSRAFFIKHDRSGAVVGIASTKPTFEKLLNKMQNNIANLNKLSTNFGNTVIDLTKKQNVDVNNITDIYSVDLNNKYPLDFKNTNMAFLQM